MGFKIAKKKFKIKADKRLFGDAILIGQKVERLNGIVQNDSTLTHGQIKEWVDDIESVVDKLVKFSEEVLNSIKEQ